MKKFLASAAVISMLAAVMSVSAFAATDEATDVPVDDVVYADENITADFDPSDALIGSPDDTYEEAADTAETEGESTSTEASAEASTEAGAEAGTGAEDKGSPDTGVEGVALVAGAAILAGGVVFMTAKKRD